MPTQTPFTQGQKCLTIFQLHVTCGCRGVGYGNYPQILANPMAGMNSSSELIEQFEAHQRVSIVSDNNNQFRL